MEIIKKELHQLFSECSALQLATLFEASLYNLTEQLSEAYKNGVWEFHWYSETIERPYPFLRPVLMCDNIYPVNNPNRQCTEALTAEELSDVSSSILMCSWLEQLNEHDQFSSCDQEHPLITLLYDSYHGIRQVASLKVLSILD